MNEKYTICEAQAKDLPAIMEIIGHAQAFLKSQGIDQWQDGYPNAQQIELDIASKNSYLVRNSDQELLATVMFTTEPEPTYQEIDGNWITPPHSV